MSNIFDNPEAYFSSLSDEEFFSLLNEFDIEFEVSEINKINNIVNKILLNDTN